MEQSKLFLSPRPEAFIVLLPLFCFLRRLSPWPAWCSSIHELAKWNPVFYLITLHDSRT